MEVAEQAKAYLEKLIKLLPEDNHNHEYFTKYLNSFETAKELADTDEKKALIADATVKVANQLTFIMFRESLLTAELEKEYRELPKPEETTKTLEEVNKVRKDHYEELAKANKEAQNEQQEIDVFQQVLGGLSKEEAQQKIEDYKNAGETRRPS